MLKVFMLFLLLIAGVIIGPMLAGHQGYVLIQTTQWNIETSVTGLCILLLLLIILTLVIARLLRGLCRTGKKIRHWWHNRKHQRARYQTNQALMKLAEGDYQQVEKLMASSADYAEQPIVNYLLAAEAAQQRGDEIRANQHLERATELAGNDQFPVEITRVRIQLARKEEHAARRGIDHLLDVAPRHPEVLRLAEKTYCHTGAWNALLDIIPSMEKAQIGSPEHREELQQQACLGLMDQAMAAQGSDGLKQWWKNQSRKNRHNSALQAAMATHLIECNDHIYAQNIILEGLKRHYDERLVLLIPRLKAGNPEPVEKVLRQHIKHHPEAPLLYSTLGQLLMQKGEWAQANDAFSAALKQRPDAYDFAWRADALERLKQPEEAAKMRQEGLLLSLKNQT